MGVEQKESMTSARFPVIPILISFEFCLKQLCLSLIYIITIVQFAVFYRNNPELIQLIQIELTQESKF